MVPYKHQRSGGKSAENAAFCHLCPWMEAAFPPIVAFKSSCVMVPLFGVRVAVEIKWRAIIKQSALNLFFPSS